MSGLDEWAAMRAATPARIGLARAGGSVATGDRLAFQLDHARARDAVTSAMDVDVVAAMVDGAIVATTAAESHDDYLRHPERGRTLSEASRAALAPHAGQFDLVIVLAGGLSPAAAAVLAPKVIAPLVESLDARGWRIAPIVVVGDGRVALGDDVGAVLGAAMSLVLIGERPGLSAPKSVGAYITWSPDVGRTDAERNCISNIRDGGIAPGDAAFQIRDLLMDVRGARVSGVALVRSGENELTT